MTTSQPPNHAAADRLLLEIREQPAVLRSLLDGYRAAFDGISLPGLFTRKLIGIGEGSSYNALRIAAPYIEEYTGLNAYTFEPEALENKFEIAATLEQPIKRLFERSYFLTVSQSGKTGSILNILGRMQNAFGFADRYSPLLAFTNNPEGVLATRYGNHVDLTAGPEQSIAATKSMTASMMALLLFGLRCGKKRAWLRRGLYDDLHAKLATIPDALTTVLDDTDLYARLTEFAHQMAATNQFVLLSKGPLSLILPEAGLKLTETSRNIVWTDNTESFKHGRKVILNGVEGHRPNCLYLVPPNLSEAEAQTFYSDIRSHFYSPQGQIFSSENVFFISFANSPAIPEALQQDLGIQAQHRILLPEATGLEALFVGLVTCHLLCHALALAKGEDPNNPALQKAVTV